MVGLGEPGGLAVDRERGLRARAGFEAGVAGGGIPFASAELATLCDFLLREPAMLFEDRAPWRLGLMSGVCSGSTTAVASSTRSPSIGKDVLEGAIYAPNSEY
jgi:hypothetical protein